MIVAVAYKWAGDAQDAVVRTDGTVDFTRAKAVVSDYDAVAIAVGRKAADALGAELVGICVGGPDAATPMATKSALSRGLDRVVVSAEPGLGGSGPTRTALALADLVKGLGDVAVVFAGDSSIDLGAKMVPAVLGGALGWPTLTDVAGIEVVGAQTRVVRTLGAGVQELKVALPAVLAVATDAAALKAPGMKDVMAAARKPVAKNEVTQLGPEGDIVATAPLDGPARRGIKIDCSDPVSAANQLIESLRADGVLTPAGGRR